MMIRELQAGCSQENSAIAQLKTEKILFLGEFPKNFSTRYNVRGNLQRTNIRNQLMSVLSDARQALVELPVSDILRERLNLAFDRTAELEQQVMTLQSKVTALEAENLELRTEIQAVTLDRDNARHELQTQRKLASATKHENPLAASNPRVTGHGLTSKRII
jgi:hypothetical protein